MTSLTRGGWLVWFLLLICPIPGFSEIVVVIVSQSHAYNTNQAKALSQDIDNQARELGQHVKVHITPVSEEWNIPGYWTILPLLPKLAYTHGVNSTWIVFVQDRTAVHLERLERTLKAYDPAQDSFIGHALRDREPTIIHHFAFHEDPASFPYPDFVSGFALSSKLLTKLAAMLGSYRQADFSIDAQHELALFIHNAGVSLTHEKLFCLEAAQIDCATWVRSPTAPACGSPLPSTIYFAVKTCAKFHNDRIPIVERTWARSATHIAYYSDSPSTLVPTRVLKIKHVEQGHCAKTIGIMKNFLQESTLTPLKWLAIVDDDTILSVQRLAQLLSCYNQSEPIALGQRYGYGLMEGYGYYYLTGGAGIFLNLAAVKRLVHSGRCECPQADTPDDMYLGMCLTALDIPILHSDAFHQARPVDYPAEMLSHQFVISFHKHWNVNPLNVYLEWFSTSDSALYKGTVLDQTSKGEKSWSRQGLLFTAEPANEETLLTASNELSQGAIHNEL